MQGECGVFHTRPSERTAGLCGSGRAACVWGSMTGFDMTEAVWRLWLGGLGASCYWWEAMFPSNKFTKLIKWFQKKKKQEVDMISTKRGSPADCLCWTHGWHGTYFSSPKTQRSFQASGTNRAQLGISNKHTLKTHFIFLHITARRLFQRHWKEKANIKKTMLTSANHNPTNQIKNNLLSCQ